MLKILAGDDNKVFKSYLPKEHGSPLFSLLEDRTDGSVAAVQCFKVSGWIPEQENSQGCF